MRNVKGFTLVELMIVVAIIGIIASFALTSYNDSVRKTKRADAKGTLLDIAAQFERCYTANGQYTTTAVPDRNCTVVNAGGALINPASTKGYYTITLPALTASTFTLIATPVGFADPQCTSFTLTHLGQRTSTPPGNACW